jgi:Histidine phosphatase superfamily (branch 1)
MAIANFITHPEVVVDPSVPVPDWPLSSKGIKHIRLMLDQPWVEMVRAIFSGAERKALEAASLMADHLSLSPVVIDDLGENDRSATGYLPRAEFETVANEFFARPEESVRGWEQAIDAQRRIVGAVDHAISMTRAHGHIAIISHGASAVPPQGRVNQPDRGPAARCNEAYVDRSLARLARLAIKLDEETVDHAWGSTRTLARKEGLSLYDAAYLELAIRGRMPSASCDKALLAAATQRKVGVFAA